jgi:excisionase family DNA binding protein
MERLSVSEAAKRLGISQEAVRKRMQRGTLPHTKGLDGRVYVYLDTDTDTWKDADHDVTRTQKAPDPEISKLCFEYFKHFTTIATAAALLELALYQQLALNRVSAVLGVGMLGLTLLLCIIGLVPLTVGSAMNGQFLQIGLRLRIGMISTAFSFLLGVMIFGLAALSPTINHFLYVVTHSIAQNIE